MQNAEVNVIKKKKMVINYLGKVRCSGKLIWNLRVELQRAENPN